MLQKISRPKEGLLFRGPLGGKAKPDTIRTVFVRDVLKPLAVKHGDQDQEAFLHGRLHSFHHYFCSTCANLGIPARVVMAWLGHSSSAMLNRYYHLHDEESQRLMEKLSNAQKDKKFK
jgi:integrase